MEAIPTQAAYPRQITTHEATSRSIKKLYILAVARSALPLIRMSHDSPFTALYPRCIVMVCVVATYRP